RRGRPWYHGAHAATLALATSPKARGRRAVVSPAATRFDELARRLAAHAPRRMEIEGFRRAAVLVPLLDAPGGVEVLFTVRAAALKSHAGEIAFPGGRLDPGESHLEAALRETQEEVGLVVTPEQVLGRLSDHPSPAGHVERGRASRRERAETARL